MLSKQHLRLRCVRRRHRIETISPRKSLFGKSPTPAPWWTTLCGNSRSEPLLGLTHPTTVSPSLSPPLPPSQSRNSVSPPSPSGMSAKKSKKLVLLRLGSVGRRSLSSSSTRDPSVCFLIYPPGGYSRNLRSLSTWSMVASMLLKRSRNLAASAPSLRNRLEHNMLFEDEEAGSDSLISSSSSIVSIGTASWWYDTPGGSTPPCHSCSVSKQHAHSASASAARTAAISVSVSLSRARVENMTRQMKHISAIRYILYTTIMIQYPAIILCRNNGGRAARRGGCIQFLQQADDRGRHDTSISERLEKRFLTHVIYITYTDKPYAKKNGENGHGLRTRARGVDATGWLLNEIRPSTDTKSRHH